MSEIALDEHNWTIPIEKTIKKKKKLSKITFLNLKFATFSENYSINFLWNIWI